MTELLFLLLLLSIAIIGLIHLSRLVKRLPAYLAGQASWPGLSSRLKMTLLSLALIPIFTLLMAGIAFFHSSLVKAAGNLTVEIISGYNLVVDSNVESPSSYAPSVATVAGKFCNTGDAPLTDVQTFIGDYKGGIGDTPGIYPTRDSASAAFIAQHPHLANTNLYSFSHVGGSIGLSDAGRYIGTLAPGECRIQYWHFSYPRRANPNNSGVAVWGTTNDPNDDLWLDFDVWGTAASGVSVGTTRKATMRNEITAMANKIEPNGGVWFNTDTSIVKPGYIITSNGVRYELGVINKGFDNDGNRVYDYNAWLQPIGDPSYDPSCFRLIRTSGVLTVSRSGGNPNLIIPFTDQLYFTNLPTDNNGVTGNVYYTFMAMNGPCSTSLTPYQEVASGADNEKYNGDYGASLPPVQSSDPDVEIDKTGNATVTLGGTLNYQVKGNNVGTTDAGLPLSTGGGTEAMPWVPLVFSDTIPAGMIYKQGSATHTFTTTGVIILYSTNQGQTWNVTEPAVYSSVTNIQWWLTDTLKSGESGQVLFGVTVPTTYTNNYIENCAAGSFGGGASFDQACTTTLVLGPNSIGDTVWRDNNNNGTQDGGETGLANVSVSLYLDKNGDGKFDSGDMLAMTTTTSITGFYTFNNLPNGNFLVQVDRNDADLPAGYSPTTNVLYAVTLNNNNYLNADFGFGPSLAVTKTLLTSPALEGSSISYRINVTNLRPGNGTGQATPCVYDFWAGSIATQSNTDWTAIANAIGSPNSSYAVGDSANNPSSLNGTVFNAAAAGNIVSVKAIYSLYRNSATQTDDLIEGQIYTTTSTGALSTTVFANNTINLLTPYIGQSNQGVLSWDITSLRGSWSYTDVNNLDIRLYLKKNGGDDGVIMSVDSLGVRVTTGQQCGGSSDTINPVPLTDTYNASLLQFTSASPLQTSAATGGTNPYTNTGTISWSNVGPLYAGQTKSITVTFKGLEPSGNIATTITNTASVNGARFVTGEPANSGQSSITTTLQPTARIGDRIWNDNGNGGGTAGNGIQDGGEAGIPGVIIELLDGSSNIVMTTTTSITGYYLFEGLLAGSYTVRVDTTSLPGTTFTQSGDPQKAGQNCATGPGGNQCDNQGPVTLTTADNLSQDFGYTIPNAVYGNVWQDNNGNSSQQLGENGIASVTVVLYNNTNTPVQTTTTNATGDYVFGDVTDGTYYVRVLTSTLPAGGTWTQTVDPDATLDSQTTTITVSGGNVYGPYNFAYYHTGTLSLGDTLYVDWNGNGIQDAGEEGIPNITVSLYEDSNGDGVISSSVDALITTTTTSSIGFYQFSNLPQGNYIVVVNESDSDFPFTAGSYQQTQDLDGTKDGQAKVNLTTNLNTVDFGYQPSGTGSIGDFVWRDNDHDGIQDTGEPGIANITVSLYEDSNSDGVISPTVDALVMTTTTNASGLYSFNNLPADNYLVQVDTSDADLPKDSYGKPFVLSTANNPSRVTLAAGQTYLNADFGFSAGATIGDLVWRDDDRDTTADATEPGLAGVTVRLYNDLNGDGFFSITDTLVASTSTSATGIYSFTGLPGGTYIVLVDTTTTPTSTFTYDLNGLLDGQAGVTLTAGQIFLGADFGLPSVNGSIGDQLWIDMNGNGIYEFSEPGVAGVVITLTNSSGVAITTTTDADGYYLFPNLASGDYTVTVRTSDLPAGISQFFEGDGTLDHQTSVTLNSGENNPNIDFGYLPDLSVSKSAVGSRIPLQPGDAITYTIVVSNPSPATITGVAISDTIPSNTSYVSGSLTITPSTAAGLVSPAGNPPVLYISPITITGNSLVTITFQAAMTSPLPAGVDTITNTVLMTSTVGVIATDAVTNSVTPPAADLAIVKSDSPDPVTAGGILTYTLVYSNNGSLTADNITITDTLPTGITFGGLVSQPGTILGPTQSGQNLVWSIGSLAPTGLGSIVFTVTVDSNVSGTITNSIAITTTTPDSNLANNIDDEPTEVQQVDVAIIKLDDPDPVVAGGVLTYTLVYTNLGPAAAQAVYITDTLPASVTYGGLINANPALSGPTQTGQLLTWYTSTLAANASGSVVFTVTVDSAVTQTITNSVSITTTTSDSNPTNNNDAEPTDINLIADLEIFKTSNTLFPITSGIEVTYTVTITNLGPSQATNIVVTDIIPSELTGVTWACESGCSDSGSGNVLTATTFATPFPVAATTQIVITGTTTVAGSATFTNTAFVRTDTPESDYTNNQSFYPGQTISETDLVITKSDSPDPVTAGGILTYSLTYTNNGPADADNVTITDTLPASITFGDVASANPALSGPTQTGQLLSWYTPTLVSGDSGSIVFTVTVSNNVSGTITNNVVITSTTPDNNPSNNDDDEPTTVEPLGTIGDRVWHDFDSNGIQDAGEVGLSGITVTLYLGVTPIQTVTTDASGIYTFTNVISGSYSVQFTAPLTLTFTSQDLGGNDATDSDADPSTGRTTSFPVSAGQVITTVDAGLYQPATSADLSLSKHVSSNLIAAGGILTYTLVYTNNGPVTATNLFITDTLPTQVAFGGVVSQSGSVSGPTGSGQTKTWTVGTLPFSQSGSIVFTVTVGSPVSGTITNSAVITSATPDTNPNNDIDSVAVDIINPAIAIAKTPDTQTIVNGSAVTFTLTVTNTGDVTLTNVTVSDPLAPSCNRIIGTLAMGAITSYTCSRINISTDFTNTASVTGTPPVGPDVSHNDDAMVDVINPAITIAKTPDLQQVANGGIVTFTISVTNTGDVTLTNVIVADPLAPTCVTTITLFAPGATNTYACTLSNVTVDFTNIATATGTPPTGPDVSDNDNAVVDVVSPGLAVDKSVNIARVAPHQIVTYTIRITNTGDVTINPVRVTDTLDTGLTYQTGTANPAPNAINGQQLVWNDVTGGAGLAPGASTQITLLAAVTTTIGIYGNSVAADGDYPGGTITPPVTDTVSTVVEDPSVELDKQMSTPGVVGDLITFTIRITNTGPSILDQIPLFDAFTGPIQYVGGTPQANTVDQVNKLLAWNDLTTFFGNLPPGQSIVITTVFRLTTTDTEFSIANVARVNGADDVFNNQANNAQDTIILSNIPTAVDLLYFTSQQIGGNVELRWATAVEYDNYGFRLLRSPSSSMADAVEIGFVPGQGQGTVSGTTYTFTDTGVLPGQTYIYWLVDVDLNGIETAHSETTSININAGGGGTILYLPLILN